MYGEKTLQILVEKNKSTLYSTFRVMHQDIIYQCFIWAFLPRSRRATGCAIASVQRTMRASTHALRMPNAILCVCVYVRASVRDSSGKPAMSVANEVQEWHATSLPADSPT